MLIIDMPKKYLTDASGFVSCTMCKKYLPLLYRDCNNDFKGCLIKGVLPDEHGDLIDRDALKSDIIKSLGIKDMRYLLPAENAIWKVIDRRQAVIAAERKDDEQIH